MNNEICRKIDGYRDFSIIYQAIEKYSVSDEKHIALAIAELKNSLILCKNQMPLPSGRWGNALAVALEMQKYTSALFMIQHAEKLDINLKQVLTEYDGTNLWNVQYAYINSLKNFNFKIGLESDILYKSNPNFIKNYNKNIIVIDQMKMYFVRKQHKMLMIV